MRADAAQRMAAARHAFTDYVYESDSLKSLRSNAIIAQTRRARRQGRDSYANCHAFFKAYRLCSYLPAQSCLARFERRAGDLIRDYQQEARRGDLLRLFEQSELSAAILRTFRGYGVANQLRLRFPRDAADDERNGDVMVLKPRVSDREKGVLFVQYTDAIERLAAVYDLEQVARHYRLVLEPSTWGYQDAKFLLLAGLDTDVIVMAQYPPDHAYVSSLGGNFVPTRLGAGDWVDPEVFRPQPGLERSYDIIMVASWLRLKRHALLFRTLRQIKDSIGRVVIIGYPFAGRTRADIEAEARREGVLDKVEIRENVPLDQVAGLFRQAKLSLMLSKREGANKSIYEALFSDVPVIVSSLNAGVNRDHINPQTGTFAADADLGQAILAVLAERERYQPRAWALANTGYLNSHRRLNDLVRNVCRDKGEEWTVELFPKKAQAWTVYANPADRATAEREFAFLAELRRP